ncbi:Uncharacterised protein [Yersinia similis]|nr:Uncharacterised protein [Yersinia similis]CNB57849.1 Uncharacterised protein [Yersinia similis]CNE43891.1 Uncharacterised protein [Yersinia similis]
MIAEEWSIAKIKVFATISFLSALLCMTPILTWRYSEEESSSNT